MFMTVRDACSVSIFFTLMVFCLCGKFEKLTESHGSAYETLERDIITNTNAGETPSVVPERNNVRDGTPEKLVRDHCRSPNDETTIGATPLDSESAKLHDSSNVSPCSAKHSEMMVIQPTLVLPGIDGSNINISDPSCSSALPSNSIASILDDPIYIDEFGYVPEEQFNSATSVSFFNLCSSTVGYPTARLMQYRLHGILSIPESSHKTDIYSEL